MSAPDPRLAEQLRKGGWTPASQEAVDAWVEKQLAKARDGEGEPELRPSIEDLKTMIEDDSDMSMGFNRMFEKARTVRNLELGH